MSTLAYYNDNDPKVCAWLRELISEGWIAPGDVDDRSIADVQGSELGGYTQCHFFAGIGGWSYALRLAGWPDDRPVWTGSCPCQPFSDAGSRGAERDERHLWPELYRLIADARPPVCFGEQVASSDGRAWLGGVRADLDALGYAVGASDLCAAGIGAPHIRQRLWWVAQSESSEHQRPRDSRSGWSGSPDSCGMADAQEQRGPKPDEHKEIRSAHARVDSDGCGGGLGNTGRGGIRQRVECGSGNIASGEAQTETRQRGGLDSWSSGTHRLPCLDGKVRRIEPGLAPLAHGIPARVVRLRGYGNAIVPQVAAEFISAYLDLGQ